MSIKLQNICVPVDFSETSAAALKYGKALAEGFDAKLHLLHVLINWVPAGDFPVSPDFYKDLEQSARKQLDEQLTADEVKKYQARLELVNGNSEFVEIIRYAKEQNIDLLVLGTHGRGPIAHMLMGSVAEKVVRKAPCPVLTVRHPEHEFVMP
jgi:universal stress protein A